MKLIKNILLFTLIVLTNFLFGQANLIQNPSFEMLDGKPKKVGELNRAFHWISPTDGTADIFSKVTKAEEIHVPTNTLGTQVPHSGDNYAGAIFYSKKTDSSREYIQNELREPMQKDKTYCVEFYVSLSDLSKYAIENIGVYFSDNSVKYQNWEPMPLKPQVSNREKRILNEMYEWQVVCGQYTAKGGEKFLTIGNFLPNANTVTEKVRKPSSIKGTQNDYGYYFIDDVAVFSSDSLKGKCNCDEMIAKENATGKMNYVYSKVEGETEETLSALEAIESKSIYFQAFQTDVLPKSKTDLAMITKLLNENKTVRLEIIGYADPDESKIDPTIAEKRAQLIKQYLSSAAIEPERLIIVKGSPFNIKESTNEGLKSQNRRIDFSIAE